MHGRNKKKNKKPLAGDWRKVNSVFMEDTGETVNVISLEDIIIDRTLGVKYWKDTEEWVQFMMAAYYDDIDWEYCTRRAQIEDCEDALQKIRQWAEKFKL